MFKKIIAFILTFIFVLPTAVLAQPDAYSYEAESSAFDFLLGLDIVQPGNPDSAVSRAQFVSWVVACLKYQPQTDVSKLFVDVDSSHKYAASIAAASELGIIAGSGTGFFYPDDTITLQAALKMTVIALGYEDIASAYGGYPTGYMRVAKELDLNDGVASADALTLFDAAILLYNCLTADLCGVASVTDNDITYIRDEGSSLLTTNFDLMSVEGVVKTAGYATMSSDEEGDFSKITIGGIDFKTELEDASKYLGFHVTGWYDESSKIMNHVYVHGDNKTVTFDIEEITEFRDFKIVAETNTSYSKAYRLNTAFTLVKNGKIKTPDASDFEFEEGTIKLIDNNSDNEYDVVYIKEARHMVVAYADAAEGIVYDNLGSGKPVILGSNDGFFHTLHSVQKDGSLTACEIEALVPDTVLTVYESEDGKYVEAVASTNKVNGIIQETGSDSVVIGETEYKVSKVFGNINTLAPGAQFSLLLSYDNKIVAFSSSQLNGMRYGYLIDFKSRHIGLIKEAQMLLLSEDGEVVNEYLSEDCFIDGIKADITSDYTLSLFLDGSGLPKYQLIRYMADNDGKICKIDTADTSISSLETTTENKLAEIYGPDYNMDNSLRCYLNKTKSFWHSSYNVFSPHAIIDSDTLVFSVPKDLVAGVTDRVDTKHFGVISTASLSNYGTYTIDAYDMGYDMKPAVIVLYNPDTGENMSVQKRTTPSLVECVTSGFNSEGEETKLITYWNNGRFYKHALSSDCFKSLSSENALPASGDVVRLVADSYGDIQAVEIDVRYDAERKTSSITSDAPADGQVDNSYYIGRSFSHTNSSLTLIVDEAAGFNSGHSDEIKNNLTPFTFMSSCKVAVYDTKSGRIIPGSPDSIVDYISAGAGNASRIVLKCYTHGIQQLFIYK